MNEYSKRKWVCESKKDGRVDRRKGIKRKDFIAGIIQNKSEE